jgi:hypothetical protein
MTEIILGYDDIGITAAAFELFWRKHRWENREWYRQIGVHSKRTTLDDSALIEYRLYADGRDFFADQQQTSIAYATIRFEKRPTNEQRISLHVHSLEDDYNQYECMLSEAAAKQDAEEVFASFIAYLHEQEYLVEQGLTSTDDGAASPKVGDFARRDRLDEIQRTWNRPIIRNLLTAALDDGELTDLCFYHFPRVYEKYAEGMTKNRKVRILLEHCFRHNQVEELMGLIQEHNPTQYSRFEEQLKTNG